MFKNNKPLLCILLITFFIGSIFISKTASAWGFWAHKRINRIAVFTLPVEIIGFFKENIDYITDHSVDADKRRHAVEDEAPKHYIDIDHYCNFPHACVPKDWQQAVEKFSADTLQAYGTSPWNLVFSYKDLVKAFQSLNTNRILRECADFGHYLADIHVPLHTTVNYNGQLTDQKGIHAFWETRVPELLGEDYDYFVGKAVYINNIEAKIWEIVYESSAAVDSVLSFEKQLNQEFDSDKIKTFEERAQTVTETYSEGYTVAYNKMLLDMTERRLRTSVINLGSFWFSAWIDAGQPDLSKLTAYKITEEEIKAQEELDRQYKNEKIKGREHPH